MLVGELMHDPGEVALVGDRRPPHGARQRVGHVGRSAHVVHEDRAGLAVDGQRAALVARRQHVGRTQGGQRLVDDSSGDEQAPAGCRPAAGAHELRRGGRRLDAHPGPFEQLERRLVDGRDGLVGPQRAGGVVHAPSRGTRGPRPSTSCGGRGPDRPGSVSAGRTGGRSRAVAARRRAATADRLAVTVQTQAGGVVRAADLHVFGRLLRADVHDLGAARVKAAARGDGRPGWASRRSGWCARAWRSGRAPGSPRSAPWCRGAGGWPRPPRSRRSRRSCPGT